MKKILALVLALCMALAAIPALAEDYTGEWYMVVEGITFGTLTISEGGAFTLDLKAGEESILQEGTWTSEGNTVTLTVDDEPLVLTETDGVLNSDKQYGFSFSREPGAMNYEDLLAMMNADTADAEPTAEPAGEPVAEDAPTLTVLQENFYVRESYSTFGGWYFVQVQNNSEVPLILNKGSINLYDADGNDIGNSAYPYSTGSRYLEPGETTFVSLYCKVAEGAEVASQNYELIAEPNGYYSPDKAIDVAGVNFNMDLESSYSSDSYYTITITNDSDEPLSNLNYIFGLKDADGNLLDVTASVLYNVELGAHSTITVRVGMAGETVNYCKANGITPASVEAYAWVAAN